MTSFQPAPLLNLVVRRGGASLLRLLFVVESLSTIKGRGVVLEPGLEPGDPLRVGEPIELRRPDGTVARTAARGIEYAPSIVWVGERPTVVRRGVLVGPNLSLADIPVGTEVWTA
jgi:hypothetical protein